VRSEIDPDRTCDTDYARRERNGHNAPNFQFGITATNVVPVSGLILE
jgi:hypothetical protein